SPPRRSHPITTRVCHSPWYLFRAFRSVAPLPSTPVRHLVRTVCPVPGNASMSVDMPLMARMSAGHAHSRRVPMNARPEDFLRDRAQVDQNSVAPFPGSRKIYVEGSRADIRVPMREIRLADTPTAFG